MKNTEVMFLILYRLTPECKEKSDYFSSRYLRLFELPFTTPQKKKCVLTPYITAQKQAARILLPVFGLHIVFGKCAGEEFSDGG